MIILPAIDLKGGRCVRLRQGRFDQETVFNEDPVAVAKEFQAAGAEWLHVVDLDGARQGRPVHLDTVRRITEAVPGMKVELGGGMRTTEAAEAALAAGVTRVVIGTQAVRDPAWFAQLVRLQPRRIALAIDAQNMRVKMAGWTEDSGRLVSDVFGTFKDLPLGAIIYTNIARDGMLEGPDLVGSQALARVARCPLIASGGVSVLEDVTELRNRGIDGVIVGRALYEGKLRLQDAIAEAAKP